MTYVLKYGWLSWEEVRDTLDQRPAGMHVVVTGRYAPPELVAYADLVSEPPELVAYADLVSEVRRGQATRLFVIFDDAGGKRAAGISLIRCIHAS